MSGDWSTIGALPSTTCVSFENAARLSFVRAFARFFLGSLDDRGLELRSVVSDRALDIQVGVPHVEVVHGGELSHRGTVSADRVAHDPVLFLGAKAVVARGDQHAHGQPLDVPLPRAGERLIEIVCVEHESSLGRGEHTEVGQGASPQHCTVSPERGVAARSCAMINAAPR